jgi:excisionase family DNA binding protein
LSSSDANRHLSLHEAADLLGVHYMTVYRRVRLGILPARKVGGTWMIDRADLERSGTARRRGRRRRADGEPETGIWRERLRARMLVGDVVGSWRVIEAAMAAGIEPADLYVRVLAPALHAIGAGWESGDVSIDQEHLASGVAANLIGRLGARFSHAGRKKGVILVAMPPGERHGLGAAMLADILTGAGYDVLNLGPDTPARVARRGHARGGTTRCGRRERRRRRPPACGRPPSGRRPSGTTVGGPYRRRTRRRDEPAALDLGADGWVADPRALGDLIESLRPA